ncbi:hypothetical protein [Protofrankia coriariae]|uniref:Uncharacterized protein n=1 Tax=Protofrankia coriariae TaxID=1562887 RepID=A0ABR5F2A4_9ACTN|nr:hypothetical protein [Protofrankia coriariae]KLL10813.1 hypothetical protein FrCorBMG51_15460 [Protofrankia coriariae]
MDRSSLTSRDDRQDDGQLDDVDQVPAVAAWSGRRLPTTGATAHYSRITGRVTVIVDVAMTAAEVTNALAIYLPGDVRLSEAHSLGDTVMLVFQGQPDQPAYTASGP